MNERSTEPATVHQQHNEAREVLARWWVARDNKTDGPHTAAYIATLLEAGQLNSDTPVCRVGGADWERLDDATELSSLVKEHAPSDLPPKLPPPTTTLHTTEFLSRFTNSALPSFANWICIYCTLVLPAWLVVYVATVWFDSRASYLVEGSPLLGFAYVYAAIEVFTEVVLILVLFLGGLSLRKQGRSSAQILKYGLTLHLSWGLVLILVSVVWEALVTLGNQAKPEEGGFSGSDLVAIPFYLLLLFVAVLMIAFEIASLVWLFRNEHRLPLSETESAKTVMEVDQQTS